MDVSERNLTEVLLNIYIFVRLLVYVYIHSHKVFINAVYAHIDIHETIMSIHILYRLHIYV